MNVTADKRRQVFGLFNVSEAARRIGLPIQKLHREIRASNLPTPTVPVGKRHYFTVDDLGMPPVSVPGVMKDWVRKQGGVIRSAAGVRP